MPERPSTPAPRADPLAEVSNAYTWFADHEATGRSPLYAELSRGVAGDRELLEVIAGLPMEKRQPNLLLTAVRHLCGEPSGWPQFRAWFFERRKEIVALIMRRRTQTNEPARCATLLPLLATLPQPLALIEVGASAGLCLLVDRYAYDYGRQRVEAVQPRGLAPVFRCRADDRTPLPERGVEVAWRAGLDLDPVDLGDPDRVAWLESLVWPSEGRRLELLRAAIEVAHADPPRVVRGDLRHDLPALAAQAPCAATLVVFHTAVLGYLPDADEWRRFGSTVAALGARWIANEGQGVIGDTDAQPAHPWPTGQFGLWLDGRPVALTDPHGTSIDWL